MKFLKDKIDLLVIQINTLLLTFGLFFIGMLSPIEKYFSIMRRLHNLYRSMMRLASLLKPKWLSRYMNKIKNRQEKILKYFRKIKTYFDHFTAMYREFIRSDLVRSAIDLIFFYICANTAKSIGMLYSNSPTVGFMNFMLISITYLSIVLMSDLVIRVRGDVNKALSQYFSNIFSTLPVVIAFFTACSQIYWLPSQFLKENVKFNFNFSVPLISDKFHYIYSQITSFFQNKVRPWMPLMSMAIMYAVIKAQQQAVNCSTPSPREAIYTRLMNLMTIVSMDLQHIQPMFMALYLVMPQYAVALSISACMLPII